MNHQAEHIHAYLSGLMNADDVTAFKKELETDKEFKDYFAICKELYANFSENDWSNLPLEQFKEDVKAYETYYKSNKAKAIKEAITNAESSYFENPPKSNNTFKLFYKVIAVAAILCCVYLGYRLNSTPSNLELYSNYKDWNQLPSLTLRGDNNEYLVNGERFFKAKNYDKAAIAFQDWIKTNPETYNSTVLLYLGISHLEMNNINKAIEAFTKVSDSENLDASKAYWYLALTYLKIDDTEKAIEQLQKMNNNKKAKELLNKLE
ncbi:tetratricopeptide repeat protein [uncultured Lacinutrix sp.]|uniref:tetratricopeptide repeat protein n=1 Tax=uncultured Lacinutrix sp. TaxID=574032 RepID=UPI0026112FF2|nr:tetratricopeptide repeat protein [uncultured Lacinutrix sp.]